MNLFKLTSTYEHFLPVGNNSQLVRIEIFRSAADLNIYRARIWIQNTYNLYPTFMNTSNEGGDLHCLHSSDQLNSDITSVVAEDPSLITGIQFENENQFLAYVNILLENYKKTIT